MKQSIVVTGSNGQLGRCLQDIAPFYPSIQFHFFDRSLLPLDDFDKVRHTLFSLKPMAVINAAAYTAVDKAETEKAIASLMNGKAVGMLAAACKDAGTRLLHISTDYVFDGKGQSPYQESDPVSPVNYYGASKLEGEILALTANPDTAIVRTSWVYSRHGNNFVKTMLRLMKDRESIGVVNDQFGCPTYAIDLAEILVKMAIAEHAGSGIYHFSNSGPITWFDFAKAIREVSGSKCFVNPISTAQFPTPAVRPAFSALDNNRINHEFGISRKPWLESLKVCLLQLQ